MLRANGRKCEANVFFRQGEGVGRAVCNRCSLAIQKEAVAYYSSWIKKRIIKLIICAILVLAGLFVFMNVLTRSFFSSLFTTIGLWLVAGLIANTGFEKDPKTLKETVSEMQHPISNFVYNLIGYIFLAPVFVLVGWIGLLRNYLSYKKELALLTRIKQAVYA